MARRLFNAFSNGSPAAKEAAAEEEVVSEDDEEEEEEWTSVAEVGELESAVLSLHAELTAARVEIAALKGEREREAAALLPPSVATATLPAHRAPPGPRRTQNGVGLSRQPAALTHVRPPTSGAPARGQA